MVKGQTIGDDTWGKVNLTNGLTLLMMGSADPVPELPTEKVKFLEDMTEAQLARHMQHPGGLKNLGKYRSLIRQALIITINLIFQVILVI